MESLPETPKHMNKLNFKSLLLIYFFTLLFICTGCSIKQQQSPVSLLAVSDYPVFKDDLDYVNLKQSLKKSLIYYRNLDQKKNVQFGKDLFSTNHMIKTLNRFLFFISKKPSITDLNTFIKSNFLVYKSNGSKKKNSVLFTGYYEPVLSGSLYKTDIYQFPLYTIPDDLVLINSSLFNIPGNKILKGRVKKDHTVTVPYFDRKQIDTENALLNCASNLVWVKDKIDLFFLHIQGSGKIILNSGKVMNVHYHTSNGLPYKSIGALLIKENKIEKDKISLQSIQKYLNNHPKEIDRILNYNPSYVFFKEEKKGPKGCLDVILTPGRSLALDRRIFTLGGISFIQTKKPVINASGKIKRWDSFSRFVVNQDTGGAIKGTARADLFCGNGFYAKIFAGNMKQQGDLYFIVLKPQKK